MADRVDLGEALHDPVIGVAQDRHHLRDGLDVVFHRNLAHDLVAARLGVDETRTRDPDALDEALAEHLLAGHVEELELQRRRAAVYNQYLVDFLSHLLLAATERGPPV